MELYSAIDNLKIDIANQYGKDKLNFKDRIAWVNENILIEANTDLSIIFDLASTAEEPELAFAAICAYRDYLSGSESGYRISFDSAASGCQIMSVLSEDWEGLKLTGADKDRHDLYTAMYNKFKELYQKKFGTTPEYTRKDIKQAIMEMLYGGSAIGIFTDSSHRKVMYETLDRYLPQVSRLRNLLMKTINHAVTKYEWEMPDGFNCVAKTEGMFAEEREILGKQVQIKYKDEAYDPHYKGNVAHIIHSFDSMIVREMIRRTKFEPEKVQKIVTWFKEFEDISSDKANKLISQIGNTNGQLIEKMIDKYKQSKFLTVRIIEFIHTEKDAFNVYLSLGKEYVETLCSVLNKMLQHKPFDLLIVHDCFTCHPNKMNFVRYWYKELLIAITPPEVIKSVLAYFPRGKELSEPFLNEDKQFVEFIRNGNYFIC